MLWRPPACTPYPFLFFFCFHAVPGHLKAFFPVSVLFVAGPGRCPCSECRAFFWGTDGAFSFLVSLPGRCLSGSLFVASQAMRSMGFFFFLGFFFASVWPLVSQFSFCSPATPLLPGPFFHPFGFFHTRFLCFSFFFLLILFFFAFTFHFLSPVWRLFGARNCSLYLPFQTFSVIVAHGCPFYPPCADCPFFPCFEMIERFFFPSLLLFFTVPRNSVSPQFGTLFPPPPFWPVLSKPPPNFFL